MPISDLPHDVLEAITMDLEPSEVASMAAASRACYEAVMPLLLESIRIHSDPIQPTMENALALISLLGRRVDFASSVKTLELRGDFDRNESSQRAFTAFCGISASLVRLSTLYLRDASTLFINNHAVLRALAHHASLRTVHFDLGQYSGKPEDATFLEINSVPLTNITLSWGYHQKIYSGRTWISLSRVQYSLETLDLRKATIDVPSEDAKVWPNLISLSLHSCTIPVRLISTCFPQLRMLNLWEVEVTKDLISPGNISASAHPLSSLSTLQTDLLSAKRLVAELKTSLIPSLVVSTAINDHMVPDDLGTLLTHVPPVVLEISFVVPFKNVLKGVLDIGPLRQTIVLYISIHIPQVSSSEDIDDTLDLLEDTISAVMVIAPSLRYLHITLVSSLKTRGPQPFSLLPDFWDIGDLVHHLASFDSALTRFSITWKQAGWKACRYSAVDEMVDGKCCGRRWARDYDWTQLTTDKVQRLAKSGDSALELALLPQQDIMAANEYEELYGNT